MDRELLDSKKLYARDDSSKSKDDKGVCQVSSKSQEKIQDLVSNNQNLVNVLETTITHFFPKFSQWLKRIHDPRNQSLITYDLSTILWVALISMITQRKARYNIHHQMNNSQIAQNIKAFCCQDLLEDLPHGDTVEYSMMRIQEKELEEIIAKMVKQLLKKRVLEGYRLFDKHHTIAIDGCHTHTFNYKHCPACLKRQDKNGKASWSHWKLQACLVTPTGLCLPIAAEWIQNKEGDYDKQDCETKAFKRLLKKIRDLYPKLSICVLLDALYATNPIAGELKKHNMESIIVFKKGNLPETYDWVMGWVDRAQNENIIIDQSLQEIQCRVPNCHDQRSHPAKGESKQKTRIITTKTVYRWKANIAHWGNDRIFNVLTCKEVTDGKTNCDYVWLASSGLNLSHRNVRELAKRGRMRWTIENQGINTLKNGGYRLEHLYSRDPVSMMTWQRVMDIAFFINQLIVKGSLIAKEAYGSIINVATRMFEHFRYLAFTLPTQRPRIQIRLRWDSS